MLTESEVNTINSETTREFVRLSSVLLTSELSGDRNFDKSLNALEAFLYTYALGTYTLGAHNNFITDCQVRTIYQRLRNIKDN